MIGGPNGTKLKREDLERPELLLPFFMDCCRAGLLSPTPEDFAQLLAQARCALRHADNPVGALVANVARQRLRFSDLDLEAARVEVTKLRALGLGP